mgnify:FL=1
MKGSELRPKDGTGDARETVFDRVGDACVILDGLAPISGLTARALGDVVLFNTGVFGARFHNL